ERRPPAASHGGGGREAVLGGHGEGSEEEIRGLTRRRRLAVYSSDGRRHVVARGPQLARERFANRRVVVHDEDARSLHGSSRTDPERPADTAAGMSIRARTPPPSRGSRTTLLSCAAAKLRAISNPSPLRGASPAPGTSA